MSRLNVNDIYESTSGSGVTIHDPIFDPPISAPAGSSSPGISVKESPYNATGDGSTNDRAAIAAADAAALLIGNGAGIRFPAAVGYKVLTNLTITSPVYFEPGAWLKPAAGVTITFGGPIDAGHFKIFDLSLGGTVSFVGNKSVGAVKGFWYGIVVDGVYDNGTILNAIEPSLDDGMKLEFPSASYTIATSQPWVFYNRSGITVDSGADPQQGGSYGPKLKWIGSSGGRMMLWHQMRHSAFAGFTLDGGTQGSGAAWCIDVDGYGNNGVSFGATLSVTAGSRTVADSANGFTAITNGQKLQINGAGPGGSTYYGYIVARTGATATLDPDLPAPSTAVVTATGLTSPSSGISTANDFRRLLLGPAQATGGGIRFSNTTNFNNEFMLVEDCTFGGITNGDDVKAFSVTTTAGNATIVANIPIFSAGSATRHQRVRIARAGTAGAVHDTTVATYISPTSVTLTVAPVLSVPSAYGLYNSFSGRGVYRPSSANAGVSTVQRCQFNNMAVAIEGDFVSHRNNFTSNEMNLVGVRDDSNADAEMCRQHLDASASAGAVRISHARLDLSMTLMNAPHIIGGPNATLELHNGNGIGDGNTLPDTSCTVFDTNSGLRITGGTFSPALTAAQLGVSLAYYDSSAPGATAYQMMGTKGVTGLLAGATFGGGIHATRDSGTALRAIAYSQSNVGAPIGGYIGVERGTGSNGEDLTALQVAISQDTAATMAGRTFRALEVLMPVKGAPGGAGTLAEGLRMRSPSLTGGSSIANVNGLVIEAQKTTGVTAATAIDQQGTQDVNTLAGPTTFKNTVYGITARQFLLMGC